MNESIAVHLQCAVLSPSLVIYDQNKCRKSQLYLCEVTCLNTLLEGLTGVDLNEELNSLSVKSNTSIYSNENTRISLLADYVYNADQFQCNRTEQSADSY